jgi:hypothetical protein
VTTSQTQSPTAQDRFQGDPEFRAEIRKLNLREEVWEALVKAYQLREADAGLTQVAWASRCGKKPAQMSRLVTRPNNLTTDTIAKALSALDCVLRVHVVDTRNEELSCNSRLSTRREEPTSSKLPSLPVSRKARTESTLFTAELESV